MNTWWFAVALVLAAACSKDKSGDKAPETKNEKDTAKSSGSAGAASTDDSAAAALAAKPREAVTVPDMNVTLDVPAGTKVMPPSRPEDAKRSAYLKSGTFGLNVFAVDEYSTPSFAKAKEVYKDDQLVEWYLTEETPTGWLTFKQVISSLYKEPRFEVEVRTKIGSRPLDCAVSTKSKALAELALEACKTLR